MSQRQQIFTLCYLLTRFYVVIQTILILFLVNVGVYAASLTNPDLRGRSSENPFVTKVSINT